MRRSLWTFVQASLLFAAAALAVACGDNSAPAPADPDGGVDAPPSTVGPCLQRETDLERPPVTASAAAGPLPCELLPPGFAAP